MIPSISVGSFGAHTIANKNEIIPEYPLPTNCKRQMLNSC
jgi:hypothetical protein